MIPRKGAEVARITEKDLRDVLEVRTSLEKLAIELACDRITEDDIHDLKLACKDFEESFGKDDLTTIAEKDVAFHDIIFRSTKNARLIQILNNLREQMYRYRLEYLKDTQSHDRLVEEHQRIVDAIIDKNKEEAVRLIQEHIYIQELTVIKEASGAGSIKKQHLQRIKILQQTMVCLRYLYFFRRLWNAQ